MISHFLNMSTDVSEVKSARKPYASKVGNNLDLQGITNHNDRS